MMLDVRGKHILITGGGSGFGAHFAHILNAAGARVTITGRQAEKLEKTAAAHQRMALVQMDVTDAQSVQYGFGQLENGVPDVVICNAGITHEGRAEEIAQNDWDQVIDTNLKGVWLVACEAARQMQRAQKPGSIITIASILGLRVAGGVAPYAISKAGVVQLTKQLALEWARHDIRVNALAPGYFKTDLNAGFFASKAGQAMIRRIPMRRLGQLDELDGPLMLLASDASRFMTGAVIEIDGGHLVSGL